MSGNFFTVNLALFGLATAVATLGQSYLKQVRRQSIAQDPAAAATTQQSGSTRSLWTSYIVVYALVMGTRSLFL